MDKLTALTDLLNEKFKGRYHDPDDEAYYLVCFVLRPEGIPLYDRPVIIMYVDNEVLGDNFAVSIADDGRYATRAVGSIRHWSSEDALLDYISNEVMIYPRAD